MHDSSSERLPAGTDVFVRGRRWTVLGEAVYADCRALRVAGSDPFNPSIGRTLLLPFDRPRPIESTSIRVVRPRRWLRLLQRAALTARPFGGLFPAAAGDIDLHPYQLKPALAMLHEGATRVLIADAVGLGKTIQAGLILRQLSTDQESFRGLVVVPASLRDQWASELRLRFDLHANVATATWLVQTTRELPVDVSPWALPGIYICSFEFIRQAEVLNPVEQTGWDLLVVDEAHAASLGSARRAAVDAIALRARRVVLLTATPHGGDDDQFQALCNIGRSDMRPDPIMRFQRSRDDVGIPERRRTVLLPISLSGSERRMHRLLERYAANLCAESRIRGDPQTRLLATILRKRALSSASALAVSCGRRLALLEAGAQRDLAEQLSLALDDEPLREDDPDSILGVPGLADVSRERRWLTVIAAAAEGAAVQESKVARLKRLVGKVKEPAIVFTEYRDTLARLDEHLRPSHPHICLLHGGMSASERAAAQHQFNREGTLLLATDAAAEGLNLQHRCRTVIHFELPWSPARLEQRTGRVDRIGQTRSVREILFVASDTAERLVLAPLVRRARRAGAVTPLGGGLLHTVSESHVAAAILDGASLDPPPCRFDDETLPAPDRLAHSTGAEALRVAELRSWLPGTIDGASVGGGIAVTMINAKHVAIPAGVVRLYTLTLTGEDGSILHTELVAVQERRDVGPLKTSADVRRAVGGLIPRDSESAPALRHLFKDRIEEVAGACRRVATSLLARERVVSAPAIPAAQQLVQRGLFDRRSEIAGETRRRINQAIVEEATRRTRQLNGWFHPTASFKLCGVLLIGGRTQS